jgi:hypothetical protein
MLQDKASASTGMACGRSEGHVETLPQWRTQMVRDLLIFQLRHDPKSSNRLSELCSHGEIERDRDSETEPARAK